MTQLVFLMSLHTMALAVFAAALPGLQGKKWLNQHMDPDLCLKFWNLFFQKVNKMSVQQKLLCGCSCVPGLEIMLHVKKEMLAGRYVWGESHQPWT